MNDIVNKLRNPVFGHRGTSAPELETTITVKLMFNAADEIERLEKEKKLNDKLLTTALELRDEARQENKLLKEKLQK